MLLVLAPIFSYSMLFSPRAPRSTVLIPAWETTLFAVVLGLSGIVGILGYVLHVIPKTFDIGLRVEGGAMALGAGGLLIFTGILGHVTNWTGVAWPFTGAWFVANVWRAVQCFREVWLLGRK